MTIKCKAVMLIKYFTWLSISGTTVCTGLFLSQVTDFSYLFIFILAMFLVFSGALVVFYLNRNEIEIINIKGDEVNFVFFNKIFFKRKSCDCSKNNLHVKHVDGVIDIYPEYQSEVKIRKVALKKEDWKIIEEYFNE